MRSDRLLDKKFHSHAILIIEWIRLFHNDYHFKKKVNETDISQRISSLFSLFPLFDCNAMQMENLITWYACYIVCDAHFIISENSTNDTQNDFFDKLFSLVVFSFIQIHFPFTLLNFKSLSPPLSLSLVSFLFSSLHSFHSHQFKRMTYTEQLLR